MFRREEAFSEIFARPGLKIERIISQGQTSPPGFWYDQAWNHRGQLAARYTISYPDRRHSRGLTTPKFAALTIKKASELNWKPLQIVPSVSSSLGGVIKPAGIENAQNLVPATYAKDATDPQWMRIQE